MHRQADVPEVLRQLKPLVKDIEESFRRQWIVSPQGRQRIHGTLKILNLQVSVYRHQSCVSLCNLLLSIGGIGKGALAILKGLGGEALMQLSTRDITKVKN